MAGSTRRVLIGRDGQDALRGHALGETDDLARRPPGSVAKIAGKRREAPSLRRAQTEADDPRVVGDRLGIGSFRRRGRVALRLAVGRGEDETGAPGGSGRTRLEGARPRGGGRRRPADPRAARFELAAAPLAFPTRRSVRWRDRPASGRATRTEGGT